MAKNPDNPRAKTFTLADIRRISNTIRRIGWQMKGFADTLEEEEFTGELEADGAEKMYIAGSACSTWLHRLKADYDSKCLRGSKGVGRVNVLDLDPINVPDSGTETAQADASSRTAKKATAKKKGVSKSS